MKKVPVEVNLVIKSGERGKKKPKKKVNGLDGDVKQLMD